MRTRVVSVVFFGWLLAGVSAAQGAAPADTPPAKEPTRQDTPAAGPQAGPQAASRRVRPAPALPSHYVMAVYFHRTHRCPTCRMIGAYVQQALQQGFAKELEKGTVQLRLIDFQAQKNAQIAAAYQITGPTLVVIDVRDAQVTAWQTMSQVWSLLARKDEFFRYVQGGVRQYLEPQ